MNLLDAEEGKEYIIKDIMTDDEEMEAFLFAGMLQWRTYYRSLPRKGRLCGLYQRWKIQY